MDRVLMLGPPGAGKGTQARVLSERGGWTHVASGDLLRSAITEGTSLGNAAKEYVDKGALVPDDLMINFIVDHVSKLSQPRFVLDGFPRTLIQAQSLDGALATAGTPLQAVVYLAVVHSEIVQRIAERRSCPNCGRTYHLSSDPPRRDGVCDDDGEKLFLRQDDDPETVQHRLDLYESETSPLIHYYEAQKKLVEVDGIGDPDDITKRIEAALDDL